MATSESRGFWRWLRGRRPSAALDLFFGLRAWGLILYGALPANLALLGMLEVKLARVGNLTLFLLPTLLLPCLVTYLLIMNRQREWYLTTDLLHTRSAIVTATILACASLISGASGIIHGKYTFKLSEFGGRAHAASVWESLLVGVGSLVLTSTLFLTLLSRESGLPGLPSPDFVKLLARMRAKLRQIQASPIWEGLAAVNTDDLAAQAAEVEGCLEELAGYPGYGLAKSSLEPVGRSVGTFKSAVVKIGRGGNPDSRQILWERYFGRAADPEGQTGSGAVVERDTDGQAIQVLKQLRLGK